MPRNGICAGHLVHVINPELSAYVKMEAIVHGKKVWIGGQVPAVLVRCQADQRSWTFPEMSRAGADGLEIDPEVTRAKCIALLMEQNGIRPPDLPTELD